MLDRLGPPPRGGRQPIEAGASVILDAGDARYDRGREFRLNDTWGRAGPLPSQGRSRGARQPFGSPGRLVKSAGDWRLLVFALSAWAVAPVDLPTRATGRGGVLGRLAACRCPQVLVLVTRGYGEGVVWVETTLFLVGAARSS